MTLQEFVRNSLLQIYNGVSEARSQSPSIGGAVKALGKAEASCTFLDDKAGFLVDFDVAVTATEKEDKDLSGGIEVARIIKVGGQRTKTSEESSVSRIRFCVPIAFQTQTEILAQTSMALGVPLTH